MSFTALVKDDGYIILISELGKQEKVNIDAPVISSSESPNVKKTPFAWSSFFRAAKSKEMLHDAGQSDNENKGAPPVIGRLF